MEETNIYKRANFFPGLKATPSFWNEMEDYHFNKENLYNRLFRYQPLKFIEELVKNKFLKYFKVVYTCVYTTRLLALR